MSIETITAIEEAANIFERSSGLDLNQAKLAGYWVAATNGIDSLESFPILGLQGPYGTGKSTSILMAGLMSFEFSGKLISGHLTEARIRDSLTPFTTVGIDEAEGINERFLINRYSKMTSELSINRRDEDGGYTPENIDMFGATVLSMRNPFGDESVRSRSIVITTRQSGDFGPVTRREAKLVGKKLAKLCDDVDWDSLPMSQGRTRDVWGPLLLVAKTIGDEEWLLWAEDRIRQEESIMKLGHKFETKQLVFSHLLASAIDQDTKELCERVQLKNLRQSLSEDNPNLSSQQISSECKSLGFRVENTGGQMFVYTGGLQQMIEVADDTGYSDPWLEERR